MKKKNVLLNKLFLEGQFGPGIKAGLTKPEIEKLLGHTLTNPDIVTPDVDSYYVDLETGVVLTILFDKKHVCYKVNLDIRENTHLDLVVELEGRVEELSREIPLQSLVQIIYSLNIPWEFDPKKVYMQTVCLHLENGLRLLYSFGKKEENDFGLFSIHSILEPYTFLD